MDNMVGEEVGIYGVFIEFNTKPYITLLLSLHIVYYLGHFNLILLLFLRETVPLMFTL